MDKDKRNELLGLGGVAVDAHQLIEELESKLQELTAKIANGEPMCPVCRSAMWPVNFSHYYSEGPFPVWFCKCEENWPDSMKAQDVHHGY